MNFNVVIYLTLPEISTEMSSKLFQSDVVRSSRHHRQVTCHLIRPVKEAPLSTWPLATISFFSSQFHLNLLFRWNKNYLNREWLWYYIGIWIFDSGHARFVGCSEASPWTLLVTIWSRIVLVSSSCLRTVRKYTRIGLYCISAFIKKIQPRCMYKSCYNCYKYKNLNFSINS